MTHQGSRWISGQPNAKRAIDAVDAEQVAEVAILPQNTKFLTCCRFRFTPAKVRCDSTGRLTAETS